jgi:hypothetical protein
MQQRGPEGRYPEDQERRRRGRRRSDEGKDVIVQKGGGPQVVIQKSKLEIEGGLTISGGGAQPGAPTGQPTSARPGERRPREGGERGLEDATKVVKDFLEQAVKPLIEANQLARNGKNEEAGRMYRKVLDYFKKFINVAKQGLLESSIADLKEELEKLREKGLPQVESYTVTGLSLTQNDIEQLSNKLASNDVIFIFVQEGDKLVGFQVALYSEVDKRRKIYGGFTREYRFKNKDAINAFLQQFRNLVRGIEKKS